MHTHHVTFVTPSQDATGCYSPCRVATSEAALGSISSHIDHNSYPLAFGGWAHFAAGSDLVWYGHSSQLELVGLDRLGSIRRIVRANRVFRVVIQAKIDELRAAVGEYFQGISGPTVDRIRDQPLGPWQVSLRRSRRSMGRTVSR